MFWASSRPSSGAQQLQQQQQQPLILPLERGDSIAVGRGRAGRPARPRPTALLSPRYNGRTETATAVVELLMMGMRTSKTCWTVFKRQVINLRSCCILFVDSVGSMMMHGLAKPKLKQKAYNATWCKISDAYPLQGHPLWKPETSYDISWPFT